MKDRKTNNVKNCDSYTFRTISTPNYRTFTEADILNQLQIFAKEQDKERILVLQAVCMM
jgi:hypothetical protein